MLEKKLLRQIGEPLRVKKKLLRQRGEPLR